MTERSIAEEIEISEALSRLRGKERLAHIGQRDLTTLLRGTGRASRKKGDVADRGRIAAMEARTKSGSLRIEMTERIRNILADECLPMNVDDLHAIAAGDFIPFATTEVAEAYLTNAVAWGFAQLVRTKEILKLDQDGREMRKPDGTIITKRASYYRIAKASPSSSQPATPPPTSPSHDQPYFASADELATLFDWGGTKIGWTGATWNALLGCTKVSRACKNCYAVRVVNRGLHDVWEGLAENRGGKLVWTNKTRAVDDRLDFPKKWKRPRLVFQTSLSDPFHDSYDVETIQRHFDTMTETPHHIFQCLTKRPERAAALADQLRWPENMWIGATIEANSEVWRADELRKVPVLTKFISAEPLAVDDLPDLDLTDIGWLIVGGESGPGAEPMNPDWARSLRDRAVAARVPFFFKQWGAYGPDGRKRKKADNNTHLDGQEWFQFPRCTLDHGLRHANSKSQRPGKARSTNVRMTAPTAEPTYLDLYD